MIYIIRHGQTIWNLKKRKQGNLDSPLTLKGVDQARMCGSFLLSEIENLSDFQIVVSPQFRAKQHASIICEILGLDFDDCIIEENLKEHCFGLWEGKTEEEISVEFPDFLKKRYMPENYWSYIIPMGESYELIYKRASSVLEKYKHKNIIYICHEMISKVMVGNLMKYDRSTILHSKHNQNHIYRYNEHQNKLSKLNIKTE
ncbi:MAG: histidine phosphatase family protein [Thermoplasmatales archaeon]|nr:MAG: histidine phosphatase family protein [Thermoplasmatales archaeon]